MTELRTVFWDVDGTLADTEMEGHRPAFNAAFAELELPFHWDEALYAQLLAIPGGIPRVRSYAQQCNRPLSEDQLIAMRDCKRRHYLHRVEQGHVPLRTGVERLLQDLHSAGLKQWIVTSSGLASVQALLSAAGEIKNVFSGIVSSDDVAEGKPSPVGYRLALVRSGAIAEQALAIEDSAVGLRAAREAGLHCLLTPSPWDSELADLLPQAAGVVDHFGTANDPVTVISGPPCREGVVTLEYLQAMLQDRNR